MSASVKLSFIIEFKQSDKQFRTITSLLVTSLLVSLYEHGDFLDIRERTASKIK